MHGNHRVHPCLRKNSFRLIPCKPLVNWTHLSCGLHTFPYAEETDDPHSKKTQSQIPFNSAHILDAVRNAEDVAPVRDVTYLWVASRTTRAVFKLKTHHEISAHGVTYGWRRKTCLNGCLRLNQNDQPDRTEWTRLVYGSRFSQSSPAPLLYN